jgi:Zn-dependent protease with chaperone function
MFALRGIAVSLTFFVLFYCLLSALVASTWRALQLFRASDKLLADLLFALRILPLVASIVLTIAFVVPSFQLLEPRSIDEQMGAMPLGLGVCALLLIAVGGLRVVAAHTKTSRMVAQWLDGATPMNAGMDAWAVTFRTKREAPPIMLVGVRKPRVLVSESTVALLSSDELRIALKHELAHIRSRDNLKKLLFRFCPFPGMARLESAWSRATELAADGASVTKLHDAVDLAAALVKLSRLVSVDAAPFCTVGLVTGSIGERVARLLAWNERESQSVRVRPYAISAVLITITLLCAFSTYGPALRLTHAATEWLVR